MRNCREITELVSQGMDKKLRWLERLAIGFHITMCSRCRNFQSQTQFLRRASQRYTEYLQIQLNKKP
ncbi:MAG: zf-HC2 domain-containing protein [Gammaproteobacteria bacterium]